MDLTTSYPRSVKDKIAGVVMIARAVDKGKAKAAGTNGEYNYDCPMDKSVLSFLDMDSEKLLDVIKAAKDDASIDAFIKEYAAKKTPAQIEEFNAGFLKSAPAPGSDAATYFLELRTAVAPDRTDVTTWADLLDLDEKRAVPRQAAAV